MVCHVAIGDIGRMTPFQLDECWDHIYPKGKPKVPHGKVIVPGG